MDAALEAVERAFAHARKAGLPTSNIEGRAAVGLSGTTPVAELLAWLDATSTSRAGPCLRDTGPWALAMLGRFDEARAILAEDACGARRSRRELGSR